MKKIIFVLSFLILTISVIAQIPNKFNYQAVVRNADGTLKDPGVETVVFRVIDNPIGGSILFEETQNVMINEYGMFSAAIGSVNELNLSWTNGPYFLEVEINGISVSASELLSVPYAITAEEVINKDDADADPANELQALSLNGNTLSLTSDASSVDLSSYADNPWTLNGPSGDTLLFPGSVSVGSGMPKGSKLAVQGDDLVTEKALFEVKRQDGITVFAVYNEGVRMYVDDSPGKGSRGGFAVGGFSPGKKITNEYLRVTPDSVRVYIDHTQTGKGHRGGFVVGGFTPGKGSVDGLMFMGKDNYFIGHESGANITDGIYNSTMGYQAGANLTVGSENIFLGYQSGHMNTTGYQNTFLGYQSGFNNSTGFQNSFIGFKAGYANTFGQNNLFLGYEAGYSNTIGNFNIFMGYRAGSLNITGTANLFIGEQAGRVNTSGNSNLFIGSSSGFSNVSGNRNLFIGTLAGYKNVSGSSNLFFGEYAGYTNTEGFYNIFIGTSTGSSNTIGSRNIFIGEQAGYMNTTGTNNSILGYQSGHSLVDGTQNSFLGFESGYNSNGSDNVYIGSKSGRSNHGSNNIFIGSGAGGLESNVSNTLIIDNTIGISAENALIYGTLDASRVLKFNAAVGISRNPLVNKLEVEGEASKSTAGNWLANSDIRIKTEIQDIENAFEVLLKLHPVKFKYNEEYLAAHPYVKDKFYYNFIAQEYKAIFPEEVQSSGETLPSVQDEILQMDSYNAQIYSIKAVQELILENRKHKAQIKELYEMIRALQEKK